MQKKKKKAKKIPKKKLINNISNKIVKEKKKTSLQLNINIEFKTEKKASNVILALKNEIDKSLDKISKDRNYTKYY